MNSLKYVLVLVFLGATPALADSLVTYTVGVGGNNNVDLYEGTSGAGTLPAYTIDGGTIYEGDIVSWYVKVEVAGAHSNPGGPGDGDLAHGAANLVCDLILYKDSTSGDPVDIEAADLSCGGTGVPGDPGTLNCVPEVAGFFSSINDGDADGLRGGPTQQDADGVSAAAFAVDLDANYDSVVTGKLISSVANDGPNFDFGFYPSANNMDGKQTDALGGWTTPTVVSISKGTLLGMGAGLTDYDYGSSFLAGVGVDLVGMDCGIDDYDLGLGADKVLFEGQIATDGLPVGTYILVVETNPNANNIIHGDVDCYEYGPKWDAPSFAVKANNATGSQVQFVIEGTPCTAPYITAAVSTRSHGGTWHDIAMTKTPAVAANSEPRYLPGVFEFTFDQDVEPTDGLLGLGDEVVLTCGGGACGESLNALAIVDDTLTVNVTIPVGSDDSCLKIDVSGLTAIGGGAGCEMTSESWRIALITGDSAQSFVVNIADVIQTKLKSGQATTGANFRFDTVVSGVINLADVIRQKLNSGGGATCP